MKKVDLFTLTVKRLGFLKEIPLAPLVFDIGLRLWLMITRSEILHQIETLEMEVAAWPGISIGLHKYGGLQFNYQGKEIGHVHSNGLLDIRFSRVVKAKLLLDSRVTDHHIFTNSGWISFYIRNADDKEYALSLLNLAYLKLKR